MASIFTRIINGEIPGRLVWEDEVCVAMVDIRPLHKGHCLVIPRAEVDHWIDLEPEVVTHLTAVAQTLGQAQMACIACERIGLMIAGFEVPHTHLHVVPLDGMENLDFKNADTSVRADELDQVAAELKAQLRAQGYGDNVPG